ASAGRSNISEAGVPGWRIWPSAAPARNVPPAAAATAARTSDRIECMRVSRFKMDGEGLGAAGTAPSRGDEPARTIPQFVRSTLGSALRVLAQRREVDHEPVADVAGEHPLVRRLDLLDRDHLDLGADPLLRREVEH